MYPNQKRQPEQARSTKEDRGSKLHLGTILVISLVAAYALWQSRSKPALVKAPPPQSLGQLSTKRITDYVTDTGIVNGAIAAEKSLGKAENSFRKSEFYVTTQVTSTNFDRERGTLVIRGVRSRNPHETVEAAREDAILEAQNHLRTWLAEFNPAISQLPDAKSIAESMIRPGSERILQPTPEDRAAWAEANLDPNRVWVSFDVELDESKLRALTSESRLWEAFRYLGIIFVGFAVLFGYLSMDQWTKGWLSYSSAAMAVGIGVLIVLGLLVL